MEKKIIICLLMALTFVLPATSQDAVSVIRKHYTEAKQKVTEYEEGNITPEYYEVNILQNLPGTGPHNERMRIYYYEKDAGDDWQPDDPFLTRSIHFVTNKYNFAAREFYEEYLYDEKGNIEFIYCRDADMDEVGGEFRLYFKGNKLFKVLVNTRNPETEEYKQTYSGATMPQKYEREYKASLYKTEKFKRMFDEIDGDTFH